MKQDPLILSLDAGGSNFVFSALKSGVPVLPSIHKTVDVEQLPACIDDIVSGFEEIRQCCSEKAQAISFAFPGPANYAEGIIGHLENLPAFDTFVPLGPLLEQHFHLPVFINNDGDLFAYGEARAGLLPAINVELMANGETRRYRNLVGLTLGTGLGCGVCLGEQLLRGDNDAAAEIWSIADPMGSGQPVEETLSVRGLKNMYAQEAGVSLADVPEPAELFRLLSEGTPNLRTAVMHTFQRYYDVLTEVIRSCIALFDGLVVLGGGIAGSAGGFLPSMVSALNAETELRNGKTLHRLESTVYNLSDPLDRERFLRPNRGELRVAGSEVPISFTPEKRSGIALVDGDTSVSIMKGAYFYAADQLRSAHPSQ
jgi:glucokinase